MNDRLQAAVELALREALEAQLPVALQPELPGALQAQLPSALEAYGPWSRCHAIDFHKMIDKVPGSFQHTNVDCLNTTTYANPLYANLISVYMLNIEKPSYYFTVSFPFNIYIEASSKSDSPSEPAYNQVCFRCFLKCHQRSALKT